jgi:tRNA modification GTPase
MNPEFFPDNSTIAAIATPPGIGGIGIIRISGDLSLEIACRLFRPSSRNLSPLFSEQVRSGIPSHLLLHGYVVHPESGSPIDEVLLVWMKAPRSYTREDVVEIQSHSGYGVLRTIMGLILDSGARQAEPGEFTRRAFLNGRIDLTQAEAVIDLIHARNEHLVFSAAHQLQQGLREYLAPIRQYLAQLVTRIEAEIDFPDDVPDHTDSNRDCLGEEIKQALILPCRLLIDQYDNFHHFRDGLRITIVGRPNVGKSSLMNFLMGRDRAIVTDIPGTTRDFIEDTCRIQGIDVVLTDTAGIHQGGDPVEKAGILRSYDQMKHADIVLFVTDATDHPTQDDVNLLSQIPKPVLVVINKIDLVSDDHPVRFLETYDSHPVLSLSLRTCLHTEKLLDHIGKLMDLHFSRNHLATLIPNIRHKQCLERLVPFLESARNALVSGMTLEGIAIDLRDSLQVLGEITGEQYTEDVLSSIFENFCIGK